MLARLSCLLWPSARLSGCWQSEQELGASFETSDEIPKGLEEDVKKYREILLDAAVELDDDVMEAYLEARLTSKTLPAL